jgi:hypothetical protein
MIAMRIAHQKIMMCAVAIATVLALDGCGITRRQEMEAKRAALKQQSDAAVQDCNTQFPPGRWPRRSPELNGTSFLHSSQQYGYLFLKLNAPHTPMRAVPAGVMSQRFD